MPSGLRLVSRSICCPPLLQRSRPAWRWGELRANTTSVPTAEGRRKAADEAVTANVSAPAY